MPCIPDHINGVKIEFADSIKNSVDQKVVDALQFIISEDVATGYIRAGMCKVRVRQWIYPELMV